MAKQPDFSVDEHGQVRDRYDEWRSGNPVYEEPVFVWPPRPKEFGSFHNGTPEADELLRRSKQKALD